MLKRLFSACMLTPADMRPAYPETRVVGVFNPGAVLVNGETVLLVRVAEEVAERRDGFVASPRIDADRNLAIDWLSEAEHDLSDPRTCVRRSDGSLRLRFISYLKVVRSPDGRAPGGAEARAVMPRGPFEEYGIEDPRITRIGETFYITYVAVSRNGAATALMSTTDFETFQRHGPVFCPDNKDVSLFPEMIGGSYVALHRPMPWMRFLSPRIWLARSPDLNHWGKHEPLDIPACDHHRDRVGGGPPPVRTERGWLALYHGSDLAPGAPGAGRYTVGALLLDLQNPAKIIGRAADPVMGPVEPFETGGFVDNVVFPTGMIERDGRLSVYYGAADENVGVAEFDLGEMLATVSEDAEAE